MVLTHDRAGVSTNVQLRILHNRSLYLGWLLHPALSRKALATADIQREGEYLLKSIGKFLQLLNGRISGFSWSFCGKLVAARRT